MLPLLFETTSQYAVKLDVLYPFLNPLLFPSTISVLLSENEEPFELTISGFLNAVSSASLR